MKISVAQTKPLRGSIEINIDRHKTLIGLAISDEADIIIFPELSLTGYEPRWAKGLATDQNDSRFADFQKISNTSRITIGVGVPTKNDAGVCISLILFQPHRARQTYSKKYLHPDEEEFFVSGGNFATFRIGEVEIAPAICYELSVPEHVEAAFEGGAGIYIASVAKFVDGVDRALERLSEIARTYSMTVLMSNCVDRSDGHDCAGKTSAWNNQGRLLGQLNDKDEGILVFDTDAQRLIERTI